MAGHPPRVAILVCPQCHRQHAVRVDEGRERVACGALAAALHNNGGVVAHVWGAGREHRTGRPAFLIDVQTVGREI